MKTTATLAALVGYAAAQQAPAYGYGSGSSSSSSSASTTTYACNPAHQYPEGQVCTEIGGSLTLVTKTATAPAGYGTSTSSAATTTTYACNPAHQYPEGQVCTTISGSLTLVTKTGTATVPAGYGTTSAPATTTYACNPAHQYPAGQICTTISGSLTLVTTTATATTSAYVDECQAAYKKCIASGQPEVKCSCDLTTCSGEDAARIREWCASATANLTSTASATKPATYPTSSTTSCAAPGSTDSQGQYSCNPAHQYPAGQECKYVSGCPVLVTVTATSSTGSATKPASYPTSSSACPAPGSTDSKGRYSCNPAHQYPEGQTCQLVDGCYFLVGSDVYTTATETEFTTICPSPTTFTHEQKTYTVSTSTVITLPCKGGCTKSVATSAPPAYTTPIIVKTWNTTVTPPVYTTKVVTELTTYCPTPTTITHQQSTIVVTKSTVLTLPCAGGCTVTVPVSKPTAPVYTTVTVSQPPVYVTETKSVLTTYCPSATTVTHEQSTYTVTTPSTLTLPCKTGCVVTVSKPQPPVYETKTESVPVAPSATPSCPAAGSTDMNGRYSCNPAHAYPAGQTCQLVDGCYYLVTPPTSSVPVQPTTAPVVPPAYPTASSSFVSQPSATMPGSSTTSLTPYTGAAAPALKTGAPLMAAVAMGALFL